MSEPKRYLTDSLIPGDDICPDAVGEVYAMVVRYADYARLKAEVAKWQRCESVACDKMLELCGEIKVLKAEVERLTFRPEHYLDDDGEWVSNTVFYRMQERLKAEVERLTKAGDAMAKLMFIDKDYIGSPKQEAVVEWCKATEGKQP